MLTEPTLEKLQDLGLTAMIQGFTEQQANSKCRGLAFEDRFALLVDAEWMRQQNKRLERRLREAKLRISGACLEDIQANPARGLEKSTLQRLGSCSYLQEQQNVLVTGATGTGKTYIACALGQQACRRGFRVAYFRVARLLDELTLAQGDGTYGNMLQRLARRHLLILDDFALAPLKDKERPMLLDVLEERYGNASTLIASQLPVDAWHAYLGEPTLADAICDRVVHNAHRVSLKGPSRRKERGKESSQN